MSVFTREPSPEAARSEATMQQPTVEARRVTVIPGDGIGPECARSAQALVAAAGVEAAWEERPAGAEVFRAGDETGAPTEVVDDDRCRTTRADPARPMARADAQGLVERVGEAFAWHHVELLQGSDGAPGWTRAQGED